MPRPLVQAPPAPRSPRAGDRPAPAGPSTPSTPPGAADAPDHGADAGLRAVVVGASAGGVDALLRIVAALPADFAVPMLVVLHRPPGQVDAGASLASLLGARCALPVADAWDRQPLAGGSVLIAPPDYHLLVDPGPVASLSVDDPVMYTRPAIDPLFETAAAVFGRGLLAVVLSGANADGTAGARSVRRHGGHVWVQDPAEAQVPAMPRAALEGAGADEVLTLAEIGGRFQTERFRSKKR